MTHRTEHSNHLMQQLLSGTRIACVVEPDSSVLSWLEQAGASCRVLWDQRHNLRDAFAREATKDAAVLVIDLDIGITRALDIAAAASPSCAVLFIAAAIDAAVCERISRVHWGFRSKSASRADFLSAVKRLLRLHLPDMTRIAARAVRMWNLPPQQARVLYYNLWSYADQDIADALEVSIHTVQEYQDELRRKTGARSKQSYLARLHELCGTKPPLPAPPLPRALRRSCAPAVGELVVAARTPRGSRGAAISGLEG